MKWPTAHAWLTVLRKAKRAVAVLWAVVLGAMLLLWLVFSIELAGVVLAVTTLPLVVIVALLEVASDAAKSSIDRQELEAFGRKRFAEVRQSFPKPEGIDALAKNKSREEVRRDMPQSWHVSDVPRQPPVSGEAGEAGSGSTDGGGG